MAPRSISESRVQDVYVQYTFSLHTSCLIIILCHLKDMYSHSISLVFINFLWSGSASSHQSNHDVTEENVQTVYGRPHMNELHAFSAHLVEAKERSGAAFVHPRRSPIRTHSSLQRTDFSESDIRKGHGLQKRSPLPSDDEIPLASFIPQERERSDSPRHLSIGPSRAGSSRRGRREPEQRQSQPGGSSGHQNGGNAQNLPTVPESAQGGSIARGTDTHPIGCMRRWKSWENALS